MRSRGGQKRGSVGKRGRSKGTRPRGAQGGSAKGAGTEERGLREPQRWGAKQRPLPAQKSCRELHGRNRWVRYTQRRSLSQETGQRKTEESQKMPNLDSLLQGTRHVEKKSEKT